MDSEGEAKGRIGAFYRQGDASAKIGLAMHLMRWPGSAKYWLDNGGR